MFYRFYFIYILCSIILCLKKNWQLNNNTTDLGLIVIKTTKKEQTSKYISENVCGYRMVPNRETKPTDKKE